MQKWIALFAPCKSRLEQSTFRSAATRGHCHASFTSVFINAADKCLINGLSAKETGTSRSLRRSFANDQLMFLEPLLCSWHCLFNLAYFHPSINHSSDDASGRSPSPSPSCRPIFHNPSCMSGVADGWKALKWDNEASRKISEASFMLCWGGKKKKWQQHFGDAIHLQKRQTGQFQKGSTSCLTSVCCTGLITY